MCAEVRLRALDPFCVLQDPEAGVARHTQESSNTPCIVVVIEMEGSFLATDRTASALLFL